MIASERIRLSPTKEQEKLFKKFSGTARFAYNECLSYKITCYKENGYSCTVQDLIEHLQELKYSDDYAWIIKDFRSSRKKESVKRALVYIQTYLIVNLQTLPILSFQKSKSQYESENIGFQKKY